MASSYTYEYRNPGFPTSVIGVGNFADVSDNVGNLVNQINSYRKQGKYESANILIRQNADLLGKSNFGASNINGLIEDIRNTQLYALQVSQEIYTTDTEPDVVSENSVWIGGE